MKYSARILPILLLGLLIACAASQDSNIIAGAPSEPENSAVHGRLVPQAVPPTREHEPVFPRSNPPTHLYVYDVRGESNEMKILLTSLQGVVAKTEPRLYLLFDGSTDPFWLSEMIDHDGVTSETLVGAWDAVDLFLSELGGVIVYDESLPGTVNAATTLAGLNNALVAAPSLLPELEGRGLSILHDFRGEFADNVSLWRWMFDNVWPLSNQGLLCFIDDGLATLRDYLVENNVFTVLLDTHITEEMTLLEEILAGTPQNIPVLGWAIDELLGVITFSRYGKFHVASDWARNLSVFSGLGFPTLMQDHVTTFDEPLQNKTYISFAYTDGDNVAYSLEAMWYKWNDPARGQIPLGWEVSFNLVDIGPQAIRYYYDTKTANDMFIAPASGIGYIYPGQYPDLATFMDLTVPYMTAADMDTIWLINDDLTLPDPITTAYAQALSLSGIFIDYWPNLDKGFYFASDGTPVLRSQYVYLMGPEQITSVIEEKKIEKDYFWADCPFFLFIGVNGWTTTPTYIKSIIDGLSDDYVVLRPDAMFAAMRKTRETFSECEY